MFKGIALAASVVSCVPIYPRVRPDMTFKIADPMGAPIANARVVLTTKVDPFAILVNQQVFVADAQGVVRISSHRKLEVAFLAPDGWPSYYWHWCAEAPGFDRVNGALLFGNVVMDNVSRPFASATPIPLALQKTSDPVECVIYPTKR